MGHEPNSLNLADPIKEASYFNLEPLEIIHVRGLRVELIRIGKILIRKSNLKGRPLLKGKEVVGQFQHQKLRR